VGSIKDFFVMVNRDPKFRAEFLENPAEALEAYGVEVSARTLEEIKEIMPIVKKHLPELANIPVGYNALLDEVAHEKRGGHTDDPSPLII
jgi:hypothetical protein